MSADVTALARGYDDVARALAARGVSPAAIASLFRAMAGRARFRGDPAAQPCVIHERGDAFFVCWSWELAFPDDNESAFILVGDRFEERAGIALFAQLLMNGACALDDLPAVLHVFAGTAAGRIIATREDADALADPTYADEEGDPRLAEQWEPPHRDGRVLRFCIDDNQGSFSAVTVDTETCAVAVAPRCRAPVHYLEGRAYRDEDAAPLAAALVTTRLVEAKLRRRLHARLRLP